MKITFVGATHEVTGSCYFLEAAGKKFLVDCGMEQGPEQSLIWWDAHISRSWNWLTGFRYGSWMPVTCWVQQASNCG